MHAITDARFDLHQPARPMLARVADSMYWMSRYVERAEHVARLLLVNSNLLMDLGDLDPALEQRQWQSLLEIMRLKELPPGPEPLAQLVAWHLTFNSANPSSLLTCISKARENARGIRESISAEMWESLNALYWSIRAEEAKIRFDESPQEIYRQVMTGSLLFQGMTDETLAHGQGWLFTQLGKYLERVDVTCRILEKKFAILQAREAGLEMPVRNIHWMAVLRSCCALAAYRRLNVGELEPLRVATFLLLEKNFPRSVRYAVRQAHEASAGIRAGVHPNAIDPAERILGRLDCQLEYAELDEIRGVGLPVYLQKIEQEIAEAALAVQRVYFLYNM